MGRLNGMLCYGVGPIDRVSVETATNWRRDMGHFLKELGVIFLDPTNKPVKGLSEDLECINNREKLKQEGKYDELSKIVRKVRTFDLRCVDLASFIVAYINVDVHLCGSWEEIFLANRQKKPIIMMVEGGKQKTPSWVFGAINHNLIFSNWDEVKTYLLHIDQDEQIEHLGRWTFLDFEVLLNNR